MGTSLSGLTPATTFDGLLKVGDNDPLTADLKAISTGDGTDTILQLSNSALSIGGDTEIDSSGLNALIVKRNGTELLKSDGSGLNGGLIFTGNLTNKFSLGVNGNDFNIWDGSYLGGGDLRFSILADGKTAIGAQTPTAQLHIKGSGATSATTSLLVQNSAGTDMLKVTDNGIIEAQNLEINGGATSPLIFAQGNTGKSIRLGNEAFISSFNSVDIRTWDGSAYSEAMRITGNTDQFVGIGETTPTAKLHIKGDGSSAATTSLLVQNSSGNNLINAKNDGEVTIGSTMQIKGTEISAYHSLGLKTYTDTGWIANLVVTGNGQPSKVGIGETTPTARLHIVSENSLNTDFAIKAYNTNGNELLSVRNDGTINLLSGKAIKFTGSEALSGNISTGELKLAMHPTYGLTIVESPLKVIGSGATSATTALLVENSAGTDLLKVQDDGNVVTASVRAVGNLRLGASGTDRYYVTSAQIHPLSNQDLGRDNSTSYHWNNVYSTGVTHITDNTTSSTTLAASAKLQVDSTTQGFLPPRMTDTERDAITTPAAGLMIYDTTNNQMNYWNGSTWIAF